MSSSSETGPFIVQAQLSGLGGTYYVAVDPASGIVAIGRNTRALAAQDARTLNEAWRLGAQRGREMASAAAAGGGT